MSTGQSPKKAAPAAPEVQYLYRVTTHADDPEYAFLSVTVGIFDPDKWEESGGIAFGLEADVTADTDGGLLNIRVNQGSMGVDLDRADLKADVYQQARDIGRFIEDCVANGDHLANVGAWMFETLRTHPENPANSPFRYNKDGLAAREVQDAIDRAAGHTIDEVTQ